MEIRQHVVMNFSLFNKNSFHEDSESKKYSIYKHTCIIVLGIRHNDMIFK